MIETSSSVSVIAHRGASAYAPEHTCRAYDLALEMGADCLELDVRHTADGAAIVVHDATLLRTCGDARAVKDVALADVEALDPATRPLTLERVLEQYGHRTRMLVELKGSRVDEARRVVDLVDRLGLRGRVTIQSFHHRVLRAIHAREPGLPLCPLYPPRMPAAWIRGHAADAARWAAALAPCATSVDAALVGAAHARGLTVHAYTVNDEPSMHRLLGLGVDALITDVPDRARAAMSLAAAA